MIADVAVGLPRNDELAGQLDLLADLMEVQAGDSFRIGAYRKAAARIRETSASVAQLALDGRAKELQGIGKTIEAKIVEVVSDGEIHALTKRKAEVPEEVALFMRLPGLGPKTARRIWQELGIDDRRRPAGGRRGRSAAGSCRDRAGNRGEDRRGAQPPRAAAGPQRALLGTTLPKLRGVVAELARASGGRQVSLAGSARRMRETVRDLDIIATASDPQALVDYFCALPWVVEVAAKGGTKATVVSNDGLRYDLRVVPPESYGNLLQHFTGSKDHNVALREDAVRRGLLGLRVLDHRHRDGRGAPVRDRGRGVRVPRLRLDPARAARERRRARGRAAARAAGSSSSSPTCAATCTRTPTGRTARTRSTTMVAAAQRARLRLLRDLRPLAAAARRPARSSRRRQIDALNEQVAPFRILKGIEVNIRADGSLDVADEDLATLDWVVASVHSSLRQEPDRAGPGGDGEPVRRLHRAPDGPQDRQAAAVAGRRRAGDRGGAARPARSSRSIRSRTGSTSPTCTRAPRGRRGSSW